MEKKIYKTLVKGNHPLGNDTYTLEMVCRSEYIICGEYNPEGPSCKRVDLGDGWMLIMSECMEFQYEMFKREVSTRYPGLCVFID